MRVILLPTVKHHNYWLTYLRLVSVMQIQQY